MTSFAEGLPRCSCPPQRLERALDGANRVDTAVLDDLAMQLASYRRLDDRLGARAVLGSVMGQLHTVTGLLAQAEAQATLGNTSASRRALEEAEIALAEAGSANDPPWAYWIDPAMLAVEKGRCYTRLRLSTDAESALITALTGLGPSFVRDRGIALTDFALVRARQKEPDEALTIAVDTGSAKGVQRIRELRAELEPWSATPAVKALDEQLAVT